MKNLDRCPVVCVWLVACIASLQFTSVASAQRPSSLRPGEYVTEGAWGNLSLRPGNDRSMLFAIEAVGGNLHVCSLDGEIVGGRATLEGTDEKTPCIVTFAPTPEGVRVSASQSDACRDYCGARAHFEGLYLLPKAACVSAAVAATRKSFKQLYDGRQYVEARAKLEPLLIQCARTLHRLEDGRIRNDLAVTLHKLGDLTGCLALLQPWAEDAALTDEGVRENYPPSDADLMLPVVRATRTNLKLCRDK